MKNNKIKVIVYDFDGVMTNNKVIIDQYGRESVIVNRSDGLAISRIKEMNIIQMIISTETNPIVVKRAEKLNIPCIHSSKNKLKELIKFLDENNISPQNVAFIGNDINDLEVMKYVEYPISPMDAHPSIKSISKYITKANGGEGVVREVFDLLKGKRINE